MAGKKLTLVLDHPPKNPTADQTNEQTIAALTQSLADRLTHSWALTRPDRLSSAWIYPTSYHIKVAVRDGAACWLSSGNWNNSNQPDIDPLTVAADRDTAHHRDRDWHVIIDQPDIAQQFGAYIANDETTAAAHNNVTGDPGPPLTPPPLGNEQSRAFAQFFPTRQVHGRIKITPLLTPDPGVYADAIKALIASASRACTCNTST